MDERTCAEYFQAVNARDERRVREILERIVPPVEAYLRRVLSSKGMQRLLDETGEQPGEVIQEVCARLADPLVSRPHGRNGVSAVASLKTWLKTVARHHLLSIRRSQRERTAQEQPPEVGEAARRATEAWESGATDKAADRQRRTRSAATLLEACYPASLPLFELSLGAGEEGEEELAAELGWSRDNLYQVRARMKKYMAAGDLLGDDPGMTVDEVLARMGPKASEDTRRIVQRVMNHLLTRGGTP